MARSDSNCPSSAKSPDDLDDRDYFDVCSNDEDCSGVTGTAADEPWPDYLVDVNWFEVFEELSEPDSDRVCVNVDVSELP